MSGLSARSSRTPSAAFATRIASCAESPNPAGGRVNDGGGSSGGGSWPPKGGSAVKSSAATACAGVANASATAQMKAISK